MRLSTERKAEAEQAEEEIRAAANGMVEALKFRCPSSAHLDLAKTVREVEAAALKIVGEVFLDE